MTLAPANPAPQPTGVVTPTLVALGVAALAGGLVAVAAGEPIWFRAYAAALAVAVVAAAGTLPVMLLALRRPAAQAGPLVMGVGLLRAILILAGGFGVAKLTGVPPRPAMGFLLGFYFALLAAETLAGARLLGRMGPPPKDTNDD